MIEILFFIILGGSAIAGITDLLTTEVPDEIPFLMSASAIFYWYAYSLRAESMMPLFLSLAVGTALLAIGMILYKKGQWGGADALILAAIGYAMPFSFMQNFIVNLMLIGSVYMIFYALALGIKNKKVFGIFLKDIKENKKVVFGMPLAFLAFLALLAYISQALSGYVRTGPMINIFLLVAFLTLFWRYGKVIETHVFRRKVLSSRLREGDVVEGMIWRGLTRKEIMKIRRQKRYVIVKEGVRFVPAFPLALVATVLWGNLLIYIL